MSLITSITRRSNGNAPSAPAAAPPYPTRPAPQPPGPHQLGTATLANLDQITSMSADEIEQVADRVLDAAHETADVLREAARRVRHSGMVANERLANFVRVASTCADAARLMQNTVVERDVPREPAEEAQPEPAVAALATETPAEPERAATAADLDKLAAEVTRQGAE